MPEPSPLEPPTEPLADQKTRLEIQKIRRELSPVASFAPQIVSMAAVVIAASQFWLAWQSNEKQQVNQHNDFLLRCIDAGMKAANYAAKLRDEFMAGDEQRQIGTLNVVLTSFPPHTALRVLDALGRESVKPVVLDQFLQAHVAVEKAMSLSDVEGAVCPAVGYVALQRSTAVQPVLPQSEGGPLPPAASAVLPLDVYVQIVRDADRLPAQRVMQALGKPPEFPRSFGPDFVPQRDPAGMTAQVRYYYADQKEKAERLAGLVTAAAAKANVAGLGSIRVVQLPARFANLARDRIEI